MSQTQSVKFFFIIYIKLGLLERSYSLFKRIKDASTSVSSTGEGVEQF